MADIKAIKGTDGTTYNLRDDYSKWGGENLILNIPREHISTNYLGYQLNLTENLVAGETYTMQLWDVDIYHSGKTAAQHNLCVYWGGGSVQLINWGSSFFTAETNNYHADYLEKTITITAANASGSGATNAFLHLYNSVGNANGTRRMEIGKWKLEKGHKATDWSPCYKDMFSVSGTELVCNL